MPRLIPVILGLALIVFALIDCAQTRHESMPPGLPKPVWLLVILLVPVVGAAAWLLVSRLPRSGGRVVRRSRPVAPDDDPEFLANLDWQARKAHYDRQRKEREARGGGQEQSPQKDPDGTEPDPGEARAPEA